MANTIDSGGQRTTSVNYTMDASIGGIAGSSTVTSPPETVKHGYIGQLSEVAGLSVTGTPAQLNEGSTSQLNGAATMDSVCHVPMAVHAGSVADTDKSYRLAMATSHHVRSLLLSLLLLACLVDLS